MAWTDNYNYLFTEIYPLEGNKEWRFALEEHKRKGTLQVNCRIFQTAKEEGGYEGPTKNGFIMPINSLEELETFQKELNKFFDKVKETF